MNATQILAIIFSLFALVSTFATISMVSAPALPPMTIAEACSSITSSPDDDPTDTMDNVNPKGVRMAIVFAVATALVLVAAVVTWRKMSPNWVVALIGLAAGLVGVNVAV